ncbi:MAG: hypothetical protein HY905_26770 [Deltaproteobacteria bacterium]|nr:hypothetical protein [Deltaproteobacteria bacterium]
MKARADETTLEAEFPYGSRLNLSYLIGVCLAVNALRDVWLVVDGPDCAHFKGQYLFGKHDWASTLYRTDGRHRIVFTGTNAQNVTGNRDRWIERTIRKAMIDEAGAVLFTSMPMCGITGAQYDRIIAGMGATRPVVEVPGHSLRGDWLDGFAETLAAIARHKELPRVRRRKGAVALVGYLLDRNEGDHAGNLAELRRILEALGLELASVWPGGDSWGELDAVARAGTIVSLPYGRVAARTLAERTGARLVETGVPIGLDGTRRWVEALGAACGLGARAERLAQAECRRVAARLGRVVPFYFLNRGAAVFADPHLLGGLAGLCTDLGMRLRLAASVGREAHAPEQLRGELAPGVPVRHEPPLGAIETRRLAEAGLARGDLVLINAEMARGLHRQFSVVDFGVPSYFHHAVTEAPFLGFEGALHLVNRMADALAWSLD